MSVAKAQALTNTLAYYGIRNVDIRSIYYKVYSLMKTLLHL